MATPDLAKLAPNLSAEERYKLVLADCLAQMDGEQPMITESELKALLWFPSKAMWQEYATRVVTFKLANSIWIQSIESEKLRTYVCYLLAAHEFERIIVYAAHKIPKRKGEDRFENLKKYVKSLNKAINGFYAYREAIPKLETELCGVPFLCKTKKASIADMYALIDGVASDYNEDIRRFSDCCDATQYIKPILDDPESYLVKESSPDPVAVAELVEEIKRLSESEISSRQ